MKSKTQVLVQKTSSDWDPCPNHFGSTVFGYAEPLKDMIYEHDTRVFQNEEFGDSLDSFLNE